jgi:DNA-binding GntR family transcriptional regulator
MDGAITRTRDHGQTMADFAAEALRADIVGGTLEPGEALRLEALKARYSVGHSPLREALSRLTGEGLVALEANKGFRVMGLDRADLADIAFARSAIETAAIRAAIEHGREDWEADIVASLHKLTRLTERTETDRESLDRWQRAHDAFHRALVAACGSPRAMATQSLLSMQHDRYRRALMGENLPRQLLIDEHRRLADAALERDAERATALLGTHFKLTSNFYAEVLEEDGGD